MPRARGRPWAGNARPRGSAARAEGEAQECEGTIRYRTKTSGRLRWFAGQEGMLLPEGGWPRGLGLVLPSLVFVFTRPRKDLRSAAD